MNIGSSADPDRPHSSIPPQPLGISTAVLARVGGRGQPTAERLQITQNNRQHTGRGLLRWGNALSSCHILMPLDTQMTMALLQEC
ncbi:hypothetical protein N8563_01515 [bacterium]|nr:hypothetical protein [bacterium]